MKYDYLIVGSGLAGSVIAERIASELDKKVLIIEKREHIAGNCYDYRNEQGILIHRYGPHIFHTLSKKVWDYMSRFTEWYAYTHKVSAVIGDKMVPVPFNFNSIDIIFPPKEAELLRHSLLKLYGQGTKIPILKLRKSKDKNIQMLAEYVYKNIFYGYTLKQWNLTPEELDFSVTSRIPVIIGRDDRYFHDTYQGIPKDGYTAMIERIIRHKNIEIVMNTDYKTIIEDIKFDKIIYTGSIDSFFDNIHGELAYRSLRFELKNIDKEYFQSSAQVNYPNDHAYTRICEFKHFHDYKCNSTSIAIEYPEAYISGVNEPYYPIPKAVHHSHYQKYLKEAEKLSGTVFFVGRLAEYKYYNMDQVVGVSLMLFEKKIAGQ